MGGKQIGGDGQAHSGAARFAGRGEEWRENLVAVALSHTLAIIGNAKHRATLGAADAQVNPGGTVLGGMGQKMPQHDPQARGGKGYVQIAALAGQRQPAMIGLQTVQQRRQAADAVVPRCHGDPVRGRR